MKITAKTDVSTKELALILGVTTRWIQQLTQDGILNTIGGRSRYNLSEAIQDFLKFRAVKVPDVSDVEKAEAELSLKKAKAIMAVLEAKEFQSKMHRSEDVAAMTEDLIFTIQDMLISLPNRLAAEVSAVNESAEAAEIIRGKVYAIMEELTRYKFDPKRYAERVRRHRDKESEADASGDSGED